MNHLYKLRPKSKLHNDFYVIDTETGRIENNTIKYELEARPEKFIFGVIYGKDDFYKVFKTREEMITELLDERYQDKFIFAHNAGYDLNVLYGNIYELDPNAIFNGKFICASNGVCKFADSLNIFRYSVERIGELLGMPKGNLGNENYESELVNGDIPKEDIEYCIQDCKIVYTALIGTFEEANDIKITQASLSLTYFRRFHQPYTISHNNNTKEFWQSYYGGRTEVFKLGKTNAMVIDINSSYPNTMKNTVFPNPKHNKIILNLDPKHLSNFLDNFEGCITADVFHKKSWIGFLPVRWHGKLCFPIGNISGCWNFNEIRFALEHGVIEVKKIHKIVYSERSESPFKDFVETLYKKRFAINNKMEIERIKIYMNSLYGKFAQKIDKEVTYIPDIKTGIDLVYEAKRNNTFIKLLPFNAERNDYFLVTKKEDAYKLNYAIPSYASYITSQARINLLSKMLELKNYGVVYCDTDSIFLEIDPQLEDEHELGGWKREDKIITEIRGLKNYSYIKDDKVFKKIKGIPKDAKEIMPNVFEYENLLKTKEALRRGLDAGIKMKRTKVLTNAYTKRIVLENGETEPIIL